MGIVKAEEKQISKIVDMSIRAFETQMILAVCGRASIRLLLE